MRRLTYLVVLSLGCLTSTIWAYSGGTGEPNDPYQIGTAQDLIDLGNEPNDYNACFILTADIDLSGYSFDRAVIAPLILVRRGDFGYFEGPHFMGTFDGQGYTISHLNIQGEYHLGLFGACSSDASIFNLSLEAIEISGTGNCIGGVVGENDGSIASCHTNGTVTGQYACGGVVGMNNGDIMLSDSSVDVIATKSYAGGLVGHNDIGLITSSYTTGAIRGEDYIGGLVGYNNLGSITFCSASGTVSGDLSVGGLIGNNGSGMISESYTTGIIVEGDAWVGGLIGSNGGSLITSCYSIGDVKGETAIGGLVGDNGSGTIIACYATGSVSEGLGEIGGLIGSNTDGTIISCYTTTTVSGYYDIGGLVGNNDGTIMACYCTGSVSGNVYDDGGGGRGGRSASLNHIPLNSSTRATSGDEPIGGFVGSNQGSIISSYTTSPVNGDDYVGGFIGYNEGQVISCFWDMDISEVNESDGGTGLTTAQMQTLQPFNEGGWDIVGETANGTHNFWEIQAGAYPSLVAFSCGIPEPNGSGTYDDPYWVADANDLGTLWYRPTSHYFLETDLDLAAMSWNTAVVPYFNGSFDGRGYTIKHLQITGSECLGLFGICLPRATISNLGLEAIDVNGTGDYIGGLVGQNNGDLITSCYITGTISGYQAVGGLVGQNNGDLLISCHANTTVNGYDTVGGLVGCQDGGLLSSCYTMGTISGYQAIGGLVGELLLDGVVNLSYSSATTDGTEVIGGLVGNNCGTIMFSYSDGTVTGRWFIGGLVGENYNPIMSCYSTTKVSGEDYIGGLVGYNHFNSTITASFWDIETSGITEGEEGIGLTTIQMQTPQTYVDAGWDLANQINDGTCDYWLVQEGTYPRLTIFSENPPTEPNGAGTENNPYLITDANELGKIPYHPMAAYRLDEDLDLAGIIWNSAVIPAFGGILDGNGHSLRNLNIVGVDLLGLFGTCSAEATLSDLTLEDVDVNGAGNYIGSLVGENSGTILSITSTGNVCGHSYVGGLVGSNKGNITLSTTTGATSGRYMVGGLVGWNDGEITSSNSVETVHGIWGNGSKVGGLVGLNVGEISLSYNHGSIIGGWSIGGLTGENRGVISSSYSNGSVKGERFVGGLVGENDSDGVIMSSYSTGNVTGDEFTAEEDTGGLVGKNRGSIWSCFWDKTTSGQSSSDGGYGRTFVQMQDISTFLNAEWDFVHESQNGIEDTWFMPVGNVPGLTWTQDHYITMPDVVGMTMEQAQQTLLDQGLTAKITYQLNGSIPDHQVISQHFDADAEVLMATAVPLVISVGIDGAGTEENPYQISNAQQLVMLGESPWLYYNHYVLSADIDLSDYSFDRAVIAPFMLVIRGNVGCLEGTEFSGTLDGQGHTIYNLYIDANVEGCVGLFGVCSSQAILSNIILEGADVSGDGPTPGALVGSNYGTVMSCSTSGTGYGNRLVGHNYGTVIPSE